MKNGTNVGEGFTRAGARGDDEVFARYAQTDGFQLMAVESVALEEIRHRVVEHACLRDFFDAPSLFVIGIELKERVGPELTFGQCRMDLLADRRISDIDKATDVTA